jgi:hypothetical protein
MTDDADSLFALPLDEFTQARDELARRLRGDGRRDEASEVAALRKPVVPAWVVNRLVREQAKKTRGLVDAAAAIRSGRQGGEDRLRASLDELVRAARQMLEDEGRDPADAVLRDVATTLRAGAAESPEELLAGRLTRPLEPSGFAAMAGAALPARPASGRRRDDASKDRAADARVEKAKQALDAARTEARRLDSEAGAAEREARRLRAEADRAARRLETAERKLADARKRR